MFCCDDCDERIDETGPASDDEGFVDDKDVWLGSERKLLPPPALLLLLPPLLLPLAPVTPSPPPAPELLPVVPAALALPSDCWTSSAPLGPSMQANSLFFLSSTLMGFGGPGGGGSSTIEEVRGRCCCWRE